MSGQNFDVGLCPVAEKYQLEIMVPNKLMDYQLLLNRLIYFHHLLILLAIVTASLMNLGIVQGRLIQSPPHQLQWFPQKHWRPSFFLQNPFFSLTELEAETA